MNKSIVVSDKNVGTCTISPVKEQEPANKYVIKALAGLQIICMGRTVKNDPRLSKVIEILNNAVEEIDIVFKGDNNEPGTAFPEFGGN